jgi:GAF domain-containing protein
MDAAAVIGVEPDVERTATEVARSATTLLAACDSADVTLVVDGRPITVGATDRAVAALDAVQDATGGGPCVDAWRSGAVHHVARARTEHRWPDYARQAVALGIGSVLAVPLVADGEALGALNLHAHREEAFREPDETAARAFAAVAAAALAATCAVTALRARTEQLQVALATRGPIEQAKGVLVARHGCTPEEAFGMLVGRSQRANRKLRLVAEDLVGEAQRASARR